MNALRRALLAFMLGLILAAAPMALAEDVDGVVKQKMTIAGTMFNGANGAPEDPVTVSLWLDKGGGDRLIRVKTYEGTKTIVDRWECGNPIARGVDDPGGRFVCPQDNRCYVHPEHPDYDATLFYPGGVCHGWTFANCHPCRKAPKGEMWNDRFSAFGDWLFMVNCISGYYTVEIDGFVEGGAQALGVAWWDGRNGERHLLKRETGEPGPWTLSWYQECSGRVTDQVLKDHIIFEYISAAGPRPASAWMHLSGRVFDPDIPVAQRFDACGNPVYSYWDVDPYQAVRGATVRVQRLDHDAQGNMASLGGVDLSAGGVTAGTATTSPKGYWDLETIRRPGLYRVMIESVSTGTPVGVQEIYIQVGSGYSFGPGSVWLPWDLSQSAWGYGSLNFMVRGSKPVRMMNIPCER